MINLNIKKLLNYDPETGIFVWLSRPVRPDYESSDRSWNTKYSGKLAGSIHASTSGRLFYINIKIYNKLYLAHRLVFLYMTGKFPLDQVDHKDRNGLNNRWENLRQANRMENSWNCGPQINNTSGFKGVHLDKRWGRYQALIRIRGKNKSLGYFDNPEDAHIAYATAAKKHFGEFAGII